MSTNKLITRPKVAAPHLYSVELFNYTRDINLRKEAPETTNRKCRVQVINVVSENWFK